MTHRQTIVATIAKHLGIPAARKVGDK